MTLKIIMPISLSDLAELCEIITPINGELRVGWLASQADLLAEDWIILY